MTGWAAVGFAAVSLFVFRDPPRSFAAPPELACAPADGTVESVDLTDDRNLRVVVRIPPFAPQVTRLPTAGELASVAHEAAAGGLLRECVTSTWSTPAGPLTLRQIAGRFGRRVVFDHGPGDRVGRGERVGVLRFGSRVEVVLPAAFALAVEVGDRLRAGETTLARLAS